MSRFISKFLRETTGAAAAEFALVSIVFAGILLGIVDMSRLAWEHNQTEKACLVGARFAVENYLAAPGLGDACTGLGLNAGDLVPPGTIPTVICDTTNCSGGFGYDAAAFDAIVNEMSGVTSLVNDPNVTIQVQYEHIGKGLCANPVGPDVWPLTTVTMTGRQFTFTTPLISALLAPDLECSATLPGEDFMTCEDGVSVPPC